MLYLQGVVKSVAHRIAGHLIQNIYWEVTILLGFSNITFAKPVLKPI